MYNIKVKKYSKGNRIKVFDKPVGHTSKKATKSTTISQVGDKLYKIDTETGEAEEVKPRTQEQIEHSIKSSMNRTKSKIYDYGMSNEWTHFGTLTLDPKKIDRYDYELCTKTVRKWFNNIKYKYYKDMIYLLVPELHKDGAIHFHCLVGGNDIEKVKKALDLEFSGQIRKGIPVNNANRYKLGFSDFEIVRDSQRASNYITKYITKDLVTHTKNKKRYFVSQNCNVPEEKTLTFTKDQLELLKYYLEKKTTDNQNTFRKKVSISSPGYSNQMTIYNFPIEIDIDNIDYDEIISYKLNDYFDNELIIS